MKNGETDIFKSGETLKVRENEMATIVNVIIIVSEVIIVTVLTLVTIASILILQSTT